MDGEIESEDIQSVNGRGRLVTLATIKLIPPSSIDNAAYSRGIRARLTQMIDWTYWRILHNLGDRSPKLEIDKITRAEHASLRKGLRIAFDSATI